MTNCVLLLTAVCRARQSPRIPVDRRGELNRECGGVTGEILESVTWRKEYWNVSGMFPTLELQRCGAYQVGRIKWRAASQSRLQACRNYWNVFGSFFKYGALEFRHACSANRGCRNKLQYRLHMVLQYYYIFVRARTPYGASR